MPLTPKQAAFVAEYVKDGNATQAAIRAGYAQSSAHVTGHELLKHPKISEALTKVREQAVERVEAKLEEAIGTEAWIVEKAAEVVNRALEAVPVRNGKGEIIDGEWTCNLGAATPALALLAKRVPAFKDAPTVDNRSINLTLPEGTSLDDLRRLREELQSG